MWGGLGTAVATTVLQLPQEQGRPPQPPLERPSALLQPPRTTALLPACRRVATLGAERWRTGVPVPGEGVPRHNHNGAQGKGVRQQHGGGRVRTEQSHVQEHCRPPIGTGGVSAPPHTAEHQAEMLAARRGFAPPSPRPQAVPVQSAALPAHCCLHVESLRILLLAEQALREGLEEALARRSALDLVLSCPGSVPFMQTALGSPRPRLCPFCPASSSGTCPARERSVRPWQRPPRWSASAL